MLENVQKFLNDFKDHIIREAKAKAPTSSGNLKNSITGYVKESANSIQITFEMEPYGAFIDQGVSGKKKKYNTEFSYTDKMPPPSKLDKWIVRKGIAPRKEGGQFASRKSLQFLIARSIYMNGIKPSLFFTKPFEAAFKKLPNELVEKYGLGMEELLDEIIKQNLKVK
jgi:ribosomal protein S17E